jgi:hypothetical protein|tara:strand:+ start:222 stop:530 length:309 start_codon:yes stop_codon:yes gene_type:complete
MSDRDLNAINNIQSVNGISPGQGSIISRKYMGSKNSLKLLSGNRLNIGAGSLTDLDTLDSHGQVMGGPSQQNNSINHDLMQSYESSNPNNGILPSNRNMLSK